MLAKAAEGPFSSKDWIFEVKWDGIRAISYVNDKLSIRSRNDKELKNNFPELEELTTLVRNAVLDGEIVVMKEGKAVAALAAGGHLDPSNTGKHEGPYGKGHLGDLPVLYVGADGKAMLPVLAPRLKVADLKGRSLMIHAGGDNYSDQPDKLGGGGARIACGVIK